MSLVIKGGTIVTADRTYKADVLVEGETIKAIGPDLKGDSSLSSGRQQTLRERQKTLLHAT